jgi:hypothetical protein
MTRCILSGQGLGGIVYKLYEGALPGVLDSRFGNHGRKAKIASMGFVGFCGV